MAFKIWLVLICTATIGGVAAFAYRASKSPRRKEVYNRLIGDLTLVATRHKLRIALSVLVIGYIQSVIGRNLAFYLHHPLTDYVKDPTDLLRHRLYDVGHSVTPDWSDSEFLVSLNELWQYCMAAAVILTAMLPYALELRPDWRARLTADVDGSLAQAPRVRTANVVVRLLQAVAIGHVLRMPTFLGTSLPGPSPHCLGAIEDRNHPDDFEHILWFPHAGANCGDLVFSGHMLFATTALCLVTHYIDVTLGRRVATRTLLAMLPLFAIQIVTILAARAHYTVDIVTGVTIAALLWVVETKVVFTREWQPDPQDDAELISASFVDQTSRLTGSVSSSLRGDGPLTANHTVVRVAHDEEAPGGVKPLDATFYSRMVVNAPLDPGLSLNSPGLGHQDKPTGEPAPSGNAVLSLPTFDEALARPNASLADDELGAVVADGSSTTPHKAVAARLAPAPVGTTAPREQEAPRRFQSLIEASLPSAASRAISSALSSVAGSPSRSRSRR